MPRLKAVFAALLVGAVALVPTAPAAHAPTLISYNHSASTGHEWDGLAAGVESQQHWYNTVVWNAALAAQQHHTTVVVHHTHASTHSSGSSSRDCVANTENGGDYGRSTNAGHFGRYQFTRQSWEAYGGNPDTWGSASPDEQDRVFDNAWSQGPAVQQQQWLKWDGC